MPKLQRHEVIRTADAILYIRRKTFTPSMQQKPVIYRNISKLSRVNSSRWQTITDCVQPTYTHNISTTNPVCLIPVRNACDIANNGLLVYVGAVTLKSYSLSQFSYVVIYSHWLNSVSQKDLTCQN